MNASRIVYFDRPGRENTSAVLDLVRDRLAEGGVRHVVIASSSGETALEAVSRFSGTDVNIVAVTLHAGFSGEGLIRMPPENEEKLRKAGIAVVRSTHALSGVERSISKKLGGGSRVEAISEALRSMFGHGMKVCVEIVVMAADNGAIPCGEEEVAVIGGSSDGADTACIVRPGHANSFFNLEVREILAMPRSKKA